MVSGQWWKRVVPSLGAGLVMACGGGDGGPPEEGWIAVVDTVADTVTVRTVSGSVWGDSATLVPEVRIGVMDGVDEYIIGEPRAIAVTPDGRILLLDTQIPVVRMYGPDGAHLRDVGRAGNGPGEYEGPDGLAVLSDGRILVKDPPNQRITVYDPSGEYAGEWHHAGGFNTSRRFYVDDQDRSLALTLLERGLSPWDWTFGLIRYSPEGEVMDTLPAPVWDYEAPQLTASREGSSSSRSVPFSPQPHWSFSPRGVFVGGLSTEYRVDVFRQDGTVLRMEREGDPVPVQAVEAEEQRRRITLGLQRQYGSWRWNGPDIPETKPPFTDLFVSGEGDVWVLRSTEGSPVMTASEAAEEERVSGRPVLRYREPPAFDVFSADGSFLGPVRVPESFAMDPEPIVRDGYVWAVVRDELDVASVVRFRLVAPN